MQKFDLKSRARLCLCLGFDDGGRVRMVWHATLRDAIARWIDLEERSKASAWIEFGGQRVSGDEVKEIAAMASLAGGMHGPT
jgi:hypothetical protein